MPTKKRRQRPAKKLSTARISQAIKALKRKQPNRGEFDLTLLARIRSARRQLAARVEPLLAKGPADGRIQKLLAQAEREQRKILKTRTRDVTKAQLLLADGLKGASLNRGRALRAIATVGVPFTPTNILIDPFMIWARPSNMLWDSRIEPQGSWAKIFFGNSQSSPPGLAGFVLGQTELTFYYLWSNPSAYHAVVNAQCTLGLRGRCQAIGNTGILLGGHAGLSGFATLRPVTWWDQPPTILTGAETSFMRLDAQAGGVWSLSTGDVDYKTLAETVDLRYELFSIPPSSVALFEVAIQFPYVCVDGEIQVDFASYPSDSITCSALRLELLTAPLPAPVASVT